MLDVFARYGHILASVTLDPLMPKLVAGLCCVLALGIVLRVLKQPHVIAYLVAGVALGPHGFGMLRNQEVIARVGDVGVVLLLFFVGLEVSLGDLQRMWKPALVGTLAQIGASILSVAALGVWLAWPMERIVLLGFVVSLSSAALVVSILKEKGQQDSPIGRSALGIILAQELAFVPMLLVLTLMGTGSAYSGMEVAKSVAVALVIGGVLVWIGRRGFSLPLGALVKKDRELQIFTALFLCFSFATLTAWAGLSSALGAFIGGIVVNVARETDWVVTALEPTRIVLVAVFFAAIGMMLDPAFIYANLAAVVLLVGSTLAVNTGINALVFRFQKLSWSKSLYGGGLLAQIGGFSFILAAVGHNGGIVNAFAYKMTVAVIAVTLAVAPFWIGGIAWATKNHHTLRARGQA